MFYFPAHQLTWMGHVQYFAKLVVGQQVNWSTACGCLQRLLWSHLPQVKIPKLVPKMFINRLQNHSFQGIIRGKGIAQSILRWFYKSNKIPSNNQFPMVSLWYPINNLNKRAVRGPIYAWWFFQMPERQEHTGHGPCRGMEIQSKSMNILALDKLFL